MVLIAEMSKVYLEHSRLVSVRHVVLDVAHLVVNDIKIFCVHLGTQQHPGWHTDLKFGYLIL